MMNDEAHHCYLPREDDRKAEGEDTEEQNKRASVWFNGVVRVVQRFKVRSIYDLSATPYYLTGSGYVGQALLDRRSRWCSGRFHGSAIGGQH